MQSSFKTFLHLVLIVSLICGSFHSAVAASNLMPADCMTAMMHEGHEGHDMHHMNGDDIEDCTCAMDGMQCQRCDADFLTSSITVMESKMMLFGHFDNRSIRTTHKYFLVSINLENPSPPPII